MRTPLDDEFDEPRRPRSLPPPRGLRIVITTTLVIGAVLVGVLVLRQTVAPAWLQPGNAASATTTAAAVAPTSVIPPAPTVATPPVMPVAPPVATEATAAPAPSASAAPPASVASIDAGPAPSASSRVTAGRKPPPPSNGAAPGDPEVVELPEDFRYAPPAGSGNLTFPAQ